MIRCKNEDNGKCKIGPRSPLICDVCDRLVPEKVEIKSRLDEIRSKNDRELIEVLMHYRHVQKCEICAFKGERKCNPYNAKVCKDGMAEYLKEEIDDGKEFNK